MLTKEEWTMLKNVKQYQFAFGDLFIKYFALLFTFNVSEIRQHYVNTIKCL